MGGREQDMDQGRDLRSQRVGVLWAFVGIAIGVGVYRLSLLAFNQMDGLTRTTALNAAAGTTFAVMLVLLVVGILWTRFARRSRGPQRSGSQGPIRS